MMRLGTSFIVIALLGAGLRVNPNKITSFDNFVGEPVGMPKLAGNFSVVSVSSICKNKFPGVTVFDDLQRNIFFCEVSLVIDRVDFYIHNFG